jgi:hypothetical protein
MVERCIQLKIDMFSKCIICDFVFQVKFHAQFLSLGELCMLCPSHLPLINQCNNIDWNLILYWFLCVSPWSWVMIFLYFIANCRRHLNCNLHNIHSWTVGVSQGLGLLTTDYHVLCNNINTAVKSNRKVFYYCI